MYRSPTYKSSPSLVHGSVSLADGQRQVPLCPQDNGLFPSSPRQHPLPTSSPWLTPISFPSLQPCHSQDVPLMESHHVQLSSSGFLRSSCCFRVPPHVGWCEISGLFLVIAAESSTVFIGSPVDRLPGCFQFGGVMGRGWSVQVLVWTCGSISPGRVPRHGIAG